MENMFKDFLWVIKKVGTSNFRVPVFGFLHSFPNKKNWYKSIQFWYLKLTQTFTIDGGFQIS